MPKMNKNKNLLKKLAKKRERKRLKRKRKKKYSPTSNIKIKIYRSAIKNDQYIIRNNSSNLNEFLVSTGFVFPFEDCLYDIKIPEIFSFENNNLETRAIFSKIINSIIQCKEDKVLIDFSFCKEIDEETIFFLNIILTELKNYSDKLNRKLTVKNQSFSILIRNSIHSKVNRMLFLYKSIKDFDLQDFNISQDEIPFQHLGYLKGTKSKKHYLENKKDVYTTKIVNYLNECLGLSKYCFTEGGRNDLEGIISEILNNAEDHSPLNTYYVTSTFSVNNISENSEDLVGVLNINVLNFGYSFYDGLEGSKHENNQMYSLIEEKQKKDNFKAFSRENIFTLLALQEGISRLKYEDQSRGTGTMKFIGSFMELGDFEDIDKGFIPFLKIYSGNTLLICSNKYKPYIQNDSYLLSLNTENDLNCEPDKNNLLTLDSKFPGTMISVKIYLNEKHLNKKLKKNDNGN